MDNPRTTQHEFFHLYSKFRSARSRYNARNEQTVLFGSGRLHFRSTSNQFSNDNSARNSRDSLRAKRTQARKTSFHVSNRSEPEIPRERGERLERATLYSRMVNVTAAVVAIVRILRNLLVLLNKPLWRLGRIL